MENKKNYLNNTLNIFTILNLKDNIKVKKSSNDNKAPGPPSFVYVIVILIFLLYSSFGIVQLLELVLGEKFNKYTKEKTYVLLSLTAKLFLGWMIFSNVLVLSN